MRMPFKKSQGGTIQSITYAVEEVSLMDTERGNWVSFSTNIGNGDGTTGKFPSPLMCDRQANITEAFIRCTAIDEMTAHISVGFSSAHLSSEEYGSGTHREAKWRWGISQQRSHNSLINFCVYAEKPYLCLVVPPSRLVVECAQDFPPFRSHLESVVENEWRLVDVAFFKLKIQDNRFFKMWRSFCSQYGYQGDNDQERLEMAPVFFNRFATSVQCRRMVCRTDDMLDCCDTPRPYLNELTSGFQCDRICLACGTKFANTTEYALHTHLDTSSSCSFLCTCGGEIKTSRELWEFHRTEDHLLQCVACRYTGDMMAQQVHLQVSGSCVLGIRGIWTVRNPSPASGKTGWTFESDEGHDAYQAHPENMRQELLHESGFSHSKRYRLEAQKNPNAKRSKLSGGRKTGGGEDEGKFCGDEQNTVENPNYKSSERTAEGYFFNRGVRMKRPVGKERASTERFGPRVKPGTAQAAAAALGIAGSSLRRVARRRVRKPKASGVTHHTPEAAFPAIPPKPGTGQSKSARRRAKKRKARGIAHPLPNHAPEAAFCQPVIPMSAPCPEDRAEHTVQSAPFGFRPTSPTFSEEIEVDWGGSFEE